MHPLPNAVGRNIVMLWPRICQISLTTVTYSAGQPSPCWAAVMPFNRFWPRYENSFYRPMNEKFVIALYGYLYIKKKPRVETKGFNPSQFMGFETKKNIAPNAQKNNFIQRANNILSPAHHFMQQ